EAVVRFLFSFDGIVELLTILPFYYLSGFVVFRMLRVVRIFHLFRINPNTDSFNVIIAVLAEKKNQILSSVFIVIILMLAASLCMYSVEHDAQPDVFENAFSGVWWSVSALLTVGYGDIYPVTVLGKLMAIVISFLGVGAVAIPTGIISAGFVEHYTKAANADNALEVSMQTVVIDIDSLWLGKTVEQIESHYAVQIVLIKRDDTTYVPKGTTVIEMKDMLVVYRKNKGSQTRDTHLV
nr:ion transporter [Solobacterium sp.]